MWYRTLTGWLAIIFTALIIFYFTGRSAVRQVMHDNITTVETFKNELVTNSLSDSHLDIDDLNYKFRKLYIRMANSQVRFKWDGFCEVAMYGVGIVGLLLGILSFLSRPAVIRDELTSQPIEFKKNFNWLIAPFALLFSLATAFQPAMFFTIAGIVYSVIRGRKTLWALLFYIPLVIFLWLTRRHGLL